MTFLLLSDPGISWEGNVQQVGIPSAPLSIKDPVATNEVNVNGTLQVLVAAKEYGVKKVMSRIVAASEWELCFSS